MAGIYIHIPFCRRLCYYCDFYKTTNTDLIENFLEALKQEIRQRQGYLNDEIIKTIYFGGGTPSVLTASQLSCIMENIYANFQVVPDAEITFESNPDDLNPKYLQELKESGINRLSIGIQSFHNEHLKKMNRRHSAEQAVEAVENAIEAQFYDLSVDLIFGLPGLSAQRWHENLQQAFRFPVNHLSAYHLTYHEGTPFYTWLKKGTLKELSESESVDQFNILMDESEKAGFEQYEISNFARNGKYSKHNTSYWKGKKYLGLGPSAHSFDGNSRRWNVAHTEAYITGAKKNVSYFEEEQLSEKEKFNEYILTRLRTKWGISLQEISNRFGEKNAKTVSNILAKYISSNKIKEENDIFTFTREGIFISDDIISDFMII